MEGEHILSQDPLFIKHCFIQPEEFKSFQRLKNANLQNSIIMSSASFCDRNVNNDHLLDGYSWAIILHINADGDDTKITTFCKFIDEDEIDRLQDISNSSSMKFGLFTGKLPLWKKIFCCGRLPTLLTTGRTVERTTAHQPIFYPTLNHIIFCSSYTYPSFSLSQDEDGIAEVVRTNSFLQSRFTKNHYTCMHPHYDYQTKSLLTYTFLHSKFQNKTTVMFHSFGPSIADDPKPIKYVIKERVALHMFGFTKNYYILFANALGLKKGYTMRMACGSAILRETDEEYCGDLEIHCIPRYTNIRPVLITNTKQKGFVYHTINCFEHEDGTIIIDALVSKLNQSRESSQFELNDRDVFDNEGDPFRFKIQSGNGNVASKLICASIDTSIDFHCINPNYTGLPYSKWWMVSHKRERELNGQFIRNISTLYRVSVDYKKDPLSFNPEETIEATECSASWNDASVYLRTPVFIPSVNQKTEDDGFLFCWSYENEGLDYLSAKLMIFSPELDIINIISYQNIVLPYSVHSFPYTFPHRDENTHSKNEKPPKDKNEKSIISMLENII